MHRLVRAQDCHRAPLRRPPSRCCWAAPAVGVRPVQHTPRATDAAMRRQVVLSKHAPSSSLGNGFAVNVSPLQAPARLASQHRSPHHRLVPQSAPQFAPRWQPRRLPPPACHLEGQAVFQERPARSRGVAVCVAGSSRKRGQSLSAWAPVACVPWAEDLDHDAGCVWM